MEGLGSKGAGEATIDGGSRRSGGKLDMVLIGYVRYVEKIARLYGMRIIYLFRSRGPCNSTVIVFNIPKF